MEKAQCHRVDPEVLGDLLNRHARFTVTSDPHDIVAELTGIGLGHSNILPARRHGKPSQMSPIGAADPFATAALFDVVDFHPVDTGRGYRFQSLTLQRRNGD